MGERRDRPGAQAAHALRWLGAPGTLVSLAVLAVNDHVLKQVWPGVAGRRIAGPALRRGRHRCHVTVLRAPGPDQCVRGPRRLHGSPGRGGGAHRHPVRRLDASLHRHRGDPSCRAPGGLRPNHRGRPHPERGVLEADLVRSAEGTWTRFSESGQRNLARTPPTPEPDSLFEPLDQEPVARTRTRPPRSTTPPPRDPSPRRRVRRSPGCPARSRRS